MTSADPELESWVRSSGPDDLKRALEKGYSVRAGALDEIVDLVLQNMDADAGCVYVLREGSADLATFSWRERSSPSAAALDARDALEALCARLRPTLPPSLVLEVSRVQRVERKGATASTLKMTAIVITISHPDHPSKRYIVREAELWDSGS